jgi:hypothetical protein
MMLRHVARGVATVLTLTVLSGCATLPPAKATTDLKAIAGKWEGTLQLRHGSFPFTSTIREDGTVEVVVPAFTNPGPRFVTRISVEDGKYRWKSETTGRTGTYILHEGDGRRVLISRADDGSSYAEATPAK